MNLSLIIFTLTLINFAFQLDFVILMPLGQSLMEMMKLSPTQYTAVVGVYTISSGCSSLLFSLFGGEYNKKKLLLIFILLLGGSSFLTGRASDFQTLFIIRLISGCFSGVINPLIFAIASDVIPDDEKGKSMGWILTGFSFASVLGIPFSIYIMDHFGFELTFFIIGLFFILTFIASLLFLPNRGIKAEKIKFKKLVSHFSQCLKNTSYVKGYLLLFFVSGAIFSIVSLISPYAIKNMGMSLQNLEQMYFFGGLLTVVTSRFIGSMCDHFGEKRILNAIIAMSVIPVMIFVFSEKSSPLYFVVIGSLMMSLMSGLMVPSMTISSRIPSVVDSSIYNGILNSVRCFGAGVFTFLSGSFVITDTDGSLLNFYLVGVMYVMLLFLSYLVGLMIPHPHEK